MVDEDYQQRETAMKSLSGASEAMTLAFATDEKKAAKEEEARAQQPTRVIRITNFDPGHGFPGELKPEKKPR